MAADDWYSEKRELRGSAQPNQLPAVLSTSFEQERLRPIEPERLVAIVSPALALAGGVGMNEAGRREWLLAAGMALGHLPEDLLKAGVGAAMRIADHPSKIVPAIIAETADNLELRREALRRAQAVSRLTALPPPPPKSDPLTPEQIAELYASAKKVADPALRKTLLGLADGLATTQHEASQ